MITVLNQESALLMQTLQQQRAFIREIEAMQDVKLTLLQEDRLEELSDIDAELTRIFENWEKLQQEVLQKEQELISFCRELPREKVAKALSALFELREKHSEEMQEVAKKQELFISLMEEQIKKMVEEGRVMGSSLDAWESYRKAQGEGRKLLNMRK